MNEAREYHLHVLLKEANGKEAFSESYKIALRDTFVNNSNPREHGFKNHVHSFLTLLKKNTKPHIRQSFKKFSIHVVSYGMNAGSEINGDRPSLIFKSDDSTK